MELLLEAVMVTAVGVGAEKVRITAVCSPGQVRFGDTFTDCKVTTVKLLVVVTVPPRVVTEMGPVVAPDGTVATICVAVSLVMVAGVPLKVTEVA